jgi:hypothetical protein
MPKRASKSSGAATRLRELVGKQQDERNAQSVFEIQKAEADRRFHEDLRDEFKNS